MLCTCSPDRQTPRISQALPDVANNGGPKDFLDSVRAKMHFTFSRMQHYADVDSTYYKERTRFIGDTVWYRDGKHPLAVVRYGDSKMNRKLLMVFNRSGKCTASLIVGMNGDVDRFDSVILDYKIIDNRSFSTTETWTYRGGINDDKITVTKQFYAINKKGRIMAQDNIIRSFTKPKIVVASHRQ